MAKYNKLQTNKKKGDIKMTETNKQRLQNIKKWAIAAMAACLLMASCAITITNINHSQNVKIENNQKASQKNDSTEFNLKDLIK